MTENETEIFYSAPKEERSTKDLTALAKTMSPLTKKLFGKKGFAEVDIITNWEKIVGEELASYSSPQKIDFKREQKNNGILFLQVISGAFALEIQHREKFILEKINTYFGYNAVSALKIVQNPSAFMQQQLPCEENLDKKCVPLSENEKNYIHSLASEIKNSKLKEILIKLGQSIFRDNHSKKE